ncbi:hypothetical protein CONPUDRAFT_159039 [Coniophora puteana RWD-64-598 SS2]|uniref:Uncharacterized protein n=1 Tax=Coniophora puteana (strain RWD-64-598) TaxID=741705 RepID=A0A5M3M9H2_CONPW|nr:uncharacterized protein CONPUDRAFT_159039 [Coniophora puteana RWD-64-598 SS2]EIW75586.1 hypothetical protein CONPUDRAFT_159039 [Coniophora puteana RWD-64-598 SS2]
MTAVPLLPGSALNFDLLLDIISLAAKPDFSAFSRGENPYAGLASLCGIHSILRKDALRLFVHTVVLPTHRELVLFQQTLQAQKDRAITGLFPKLAFNYVGNVRRIFVGYLPIAPDLVFSSPSTDADERQAHDWAMSKASTLLDDSVLVPVLRAARDIAVDETALSLMKRLFRQTGTEDSPGANTDQPRWEMSSFSIVGPLADLDWALFKNDVGPGFFMPTLRVRKYRAACCHHHEAMDNASVSQPVEDPDRTRRPMGHRTQSLLLPSSEGDYRITMEHIQPSSGPHTLIRRACVAAWACDGSRLEGEILSL